MPTTTMMKEEVFPKLPSRSPLRRRCRRLAGGDAAGRRFKTQPVTLSEIRETDEESHGHRGTTTAIPNTGTGTTVGGRATDGEDERVKKKTERREAEEVRKNVEEQEEEERARRNFSRFLESLGRRASCPLPRLQLGDAPPAGVTIDLRQFTRNRSTIEP